MRAHSYSTHGDYIYPTSFDSSKLYVYRGACINRTQFTFTLTVVASSIKKIYTSPIYFGVVLQFNT